MSWTDKASIEHIKQLRDKFNIKVFVETGTFKGVNANLQSKNFKFVFTCEKLKKFYDYASNKYPTSNIMYCNSHSPLFLETFDYDNCPIIYCDAHFYNKSLPKNKRFVILEELEAIKNNSHLNKEKIIIIIHDFKNGLGGITYDGIDLDMNLVRDKLLQINPNFIFYTNNIVSCNPKKIEEAKNWDEFDNLRYAWSSPEKTYRGFLYAVPKKINIEELKEIK